MKRLKSDLHFGSPQVGKILTRVAQIQGMCMKQISVDGPLEVKLHTMVL
jgi:hypothetical protein